MVPELLTLKNFLSYREASLSFQGLHTACICGSNGAGKSSLLEAISWVIWGKCRGGADDVIRTGEKEAQVDFIFRYGQEVYRVIRTRRLRQTSTLEFQVASIDEEPGDRQFKSITEKSIKITQAAIIERLRLDYDTFANSAYLRQGKADEFMLKTAGQRKDILADLLKLSQYEQLADQAKEKAKEFKFEAGQLEGVLERADIKLSQREAVAQQLESLEKNIVSAQEQDRHIEAQLKQRREEQQRRQSWLQQQTWQQQQRQSLQQDWNRIGRDLQSIAERQAAAAQVLAQGDRIEAGVDEFRGLQRRDEELSAQFKQHSEWVEQRRGLQGERDRQASQLSGQRQSLTARLGDLERQEGECQKILAKTADIEASLAKLHGARDALREIEKLQGQASPLIKRSSDLAVELGRVRARWLARQEDLLGQQQRAIAARETQLPEQAITLQLLGERIEQLEKQQVYQQRVREKGIERKTFIDRLEANRDELSQRLIKLQERHQLLSKHRPVSASVSGHGNISEAVRSSSDELAVKDDFGTCPLCDRPLDEAHWQTVLEKQQQDETDLREQLWVIEEQLTVSDREREVLRGEYKRLSQELAPLGSLLEERGKLQEQCQGLEALAAAEEILAQELRAIEHATGWLDSEDGDAPEMLPQGGEGAIALVTERREVEKTLAGLKFDERNLALARGEVERWRHGEVRFYELEQARRKQVHIEQQRPQLNQKIEDLDRQLAWLNYPQPNEEGERSLTGQIEEITTRINALNYQVEVHNQLRKELREKQQWLTQFENLKRCREEKPKLDQQYQQLETHQKERQEEIQKLGQQSQELQAQLDQLPDPTGAIAQLEAQSQSLRQTLNQYLADLGRSQQQAAELDELEKQSQSDRHTLSKHHKQQRIYEELSKAFGKNGLQALTIETVLPQLEAETNRILSRLSANQLHVQFITQKAKKNQSKPRGSRKGKKGDRALDYVAMTDTLEILIADARGTRPYETYSGGEAFRINFSIRLALSRLLTQRSGTALQLLIVDEGFGTQDEAGRDRLVAAINAIASEFSCILTVTHIPQLKEAFQNRIEVTKTATGSTLQVIA
ncbi:MAG: AAA family ATPase [Cyanobacteria bacterium P01_C01_bin.89]